jgi:hypothetical protein
MIQRKQSIFIGLSILISILLFLIPAVAYRIDNVIVSYTCWPFAADSRSTFWIYIVFVLNAFFSLSALLALFSFTNRKKQIKICSYSLISVILLLISFTALPFIQLQGITKEMNWILALLPIAIICQFLAIRFIKSDEELVRSADRIR